MIQCKCGNVPMGKNVEGVKSFTCSACCDAEKVKEWGYGGRSTEYNKLKNIENRHKSL